MTKEEKFLQLLYRTDEIRKIMINDVYQELLEIIPIKLCFSSKNIVKETREMNLKTALNSISNFLESNWGTNILLKPNVIVVCIQTLRPNPWKLGIIAITESPTFRFLRALFSQVDE